MKNTDIQPVEFVADLLEQGFLIFGKDGMIKKVEGIEFGSVEIHFRDGVPYSYTVHTRKLIK